MENRTGPLGPVNRTDVLLVGAAFGVATSIPRAAEAAMVQIGSVVRSSGETTMDSITTMGGVTLSVRGGGRFSIDAAGRKKSPVQGFLAGDRE